MKTDRMKTLSALAGLALLAASAAPAAEETVSFKSGAEQASGFLVTPEGKGPFPAIVVIQEWWGLNDWVKEQARALAKEGYVALAVDLYRGKVTASQEEAHQLMMGTPPDRAIRDLKAGFAYLGSQPNVRKDRIGVVGWCMGGRYALELATVEPKLAAVVAYYGPPTDPGKVAAIKAPVLGNYGAEDKGPAPSSAGVRGRDEEGGQGGRRQDLPRRRPRLRQRQQPWGGYRKEAAEDAWAAEAPGRRTEGRRHPRDLVFPGPGDPPALTTMIPRGRRRRTLGMKGSLPLKPPPPSPPRTWRCWSRGSRGQSGAAEAV
jgi:carboxymethylenebutenolidase